VVECDLIGGELEVREAVGVAEIADRKALVDEAVTGTIAVVVQCATASAGNDVVDVVDVSRVANVLQIVVVSGQKQLDFVFLNNRNHLQRAHASSNEVRLMIASAAATKFSRVTSGGPHLMSRTAAEICSWTLLLRAYVKTTHTYISMSDIPRVLFLQN
jgi:hypothetical protein